MNLYDEFKTLKQELTLFLDQNCTEEQRKKNNLNKLKSDIYELIILIENSLCSKRPSYQELLNFTNNIEEDHLNIKKADWCFTLKDYNYSVKVNLKANDKNDIRLSLVEKPNFIFYILNQDRNYKFAKVSYDDARLQIYSEYTNITNAGYDYSFSQIKESNITWLSNLNELTDNILAEVIKDIKRKINIK